MRFRSREPQEDFTHNYLMLQIGEQLPHSEVPAHALRVLCLNSNIPKKVPTNPKSFLLWILSIPKIMKAKQLVMIRKRCRRDVHNHIFLLPLTKEVRAPTKATHAPVKKVKSAPLRKTSAETGPELPSPPNIAHAFEQRM
jgi:hypothetical protein